MLIYDNKESLRIVFQLRGSVIWRTIPLGLIVAALSAACSWWVHHTPEDFWQPKIESIWAANVVGTAISFAIVYRTSMAWSRYWEAANNVQMMFSKWTDSFSQLVSFINSAEKRLQKKEWTPAIEKTHSELMKVRRKLAHDFSLLSGIAAHRLVHGDLGRMRRRSELRGMRSGWLGPCRVLINWDEHVVFRQQLRVNDFTEALKLPRFKEYSLSGNGSSTSHLLLSGTSAFMMEEMASSDRHSPEQADGKIDLRAGIPDPIVSPARGEHDASTRDAALVAEKRGNKLEQRAVVSNWGVHLVILDSLTSEETDLLHRHASDRINLVSLWVQEDINDLVQVCDTPPPIMSRSYQELSNGMLGYNQAMKMADIPFPFPFAQLLELLLCAWTTMIPAYSARFTGGLIASPVLALMVTVAFWSLSEISRELETPFADGPNQLPVIDMHDRFIEALRITYASGKQNEYLCDKRVSKGSHSSKRFQPPAELDSLEEITV